MRRSIRPQRLGCPLSLGARVSDGLGHGYQNVMTMGDLPRRVAWKCRLGAFQGHWIIFSLQEMWSVQIHALLARMICGWVGGASVHCQARRETSRAQPNERQWTQARRLRSAVCSMSLKTFPVIESGLELAPKGSRFACVQLVEIFRAGVGAVYVMLVGGLAQPARALDGEDTNSSANLWLPPRLADRTRVCPTTT